MSNNNILSVFCLCIEKSVDLDTINLLEALKNINGDSNMSNIDDFSWIIDEEQSSLTIWNCRNCNYRAFENESDERTCKKCGKKTESKLKKKNRNQKSK